MDDLVIKVECPSGRLKDSGRQIGDQVRLTGTFVEHGIELGAAGENNALGGLRLTRHKWRCVRSRDTEGQCADDQDWHECRS